MRLLVSVAHAEEAIAALDGGADLVDAKDPLAGALGAVSLDTFRAICVAVGDARPISAALGDATDAAMAERTARAYTTAGAALVKIGLAGVTRADRARSLIEAAVRGARAGGGRAIAVAYADADRAVSLPPRAIIAAAAGAGAAGLLVDTADKQGPGLLRLIPPGELAALVTEAREAALLVALAGRLAPDDLSLVRAAGADIAGVRGAACAGGRAGRVAAGAVRRLRALCRDAS